MKVLQTAQFKKDLKKQLNCGKDKEKFMASFTDRYPLNVAGKYYIDMRCTDCDLCRECAPGNIKRDDRTGVSYVFRQPQTIDEIKEVEEGAMGCPTNAVVNDGDRFDWEREPIYDWNSL